MQEDFAARMMAAQMHAHPGGRAHDHRPDLDQLESQGGASRSRQCGARERQSAQAHHQRVGQRREQDAPLIGPPAMGAHPISKEHHLLFDPVFHLAAGAVAPVVELLRVAHDVGNNEPRIGALGRVLGFGDHPAQSTPRSRRVIKRGEQALFFAGGREALGRGGHQLRGQRLQPTIARNTHDILHVVAITPSEHQVAAKPAVRSHHDLRARPYLPDMLHQEFEDRSRVAGPIGVGTSQVGHEQMVAAKHIQR